MKREFIYAPQFYTKWDNLKLTDTELSELEQYLLDNPNAGDIMQSTGGVRKIRWSLKNKGKSGGLRVLYIDFMVQEKIFIFDLFTKDEKQNLTDKEKSELKQIVKIIGEELKK